MSRAHRSSGWAAFLVIGLALACAVGQASTAKSLRFERLGVEQGLTQESVLAILQDRQGFLWFGSQAGLGRYDGYRVLTFRSEPDQAGSLADNFVTALHEDKSGRLWVGTRGGGVMRYDAASRTFLRFLPPASAQRGSGELHVRAIVAEPASAGGRPERLWIATAGGLQRLDTADDSFESWHHDPARADSLVDDDVLALVRDPQGRLWIGTGAGLDRLDPQSDRFEHFRVDSDAEPDRRRNTVQALGVDSVGTLWVGSSRGLESWGIEGATPQRQRLADDQGEIVDAVRAILLDRNGGVWIGTPSGLLRRDAGNGPLLRYRHDARDPNSLADNDIDSLYQDRGGTLWVGTHTGGASRVDLNSGGFERIVGLVNDDDARDANKVYAVSSDGGGNLWLGTLGGGLLRVERGSTEVTVYRHDPANPLSLPNDNVRAVHVDGQGTVWAGTDAGLARLDAVTGRLRIRHFGELGPTLDSIRQIRPSTTGILWLGSEGGLHRYDPQSDTVRSFRHDPADPGSLSQGRVLAVFEDRAGTLWVGTDSGLDRQDTDTGPFRHFRHEPADPASLSHSRVHHLFETRSGQLWIGTAGGLNRLDATRDGGVRFRRYTHQDGLAADPIGAILPDASGGLWISTTAGLSRFEPSTSRFRNYSARDGLIDSGYYIGAGHTSSDGTLYFGGLSGLTAFRPEAIRDNLIPPPVVITELQIFNRAVLGAARPDGVRFDGVIETAPSLRLSHANAVFSLEFAALHFADPRRNRYAYQLVGFDPDWIETDSSRRFVTYTNLAPADYTFRVKASNKDGIWNNTGSSIDIHVEPPYWATWWFRTLLATFLLGSVWAVIRYRVRGLTRQRAWLQQQVAARTAEVVRQKEDIEQAHGNLAVLGEIGREITASLDETAIFQTLDRHVHGLLDATTFGIYLLDADAKGLTSAWRVEGGEALPVRQVALDAPDANLARCARERSELLVEYPIEEAKGVSLPGTVPTLSALFAPLVIGDRLLGAMTIQSPQQHAYGEREKVIFRSLCAYGAIALDNALAYRRLAEADAEVQRVLGEQKRWLEQEVSARTVEVLQQKADIEQANSTLSVLGEIGREITAMLVEDEVCATLARHVNGLLDATTFAVYLLDDNGRLLTSALRVEAGGVLPSASIEIDHPIRNAARCARERQELYVETEPGAFNPSHVPGTLRTLSSLFAPLMIGERLLGVMTIQSPREHAYSERERLVFRTLCAYGAIALDNAAAYRRLGESDAEIQRVLREQQSWLEQEVSARTAEVVQQKEDIEQAHRDLSGLGEIGREITASLDETAIFDTLDRHVSGLLDATCFGIYRLHHERQTLDQVRMVENGAALPQESIALVSPTRHAARCARERRELLLDWAPDEEDPSLVPGTLNTLSALFAPLMIGGRLLGVMTIQSPRRHAYGEREQLVFRTLCAYGAIALDNAAAYRRLAEADADVQRMLREQQVIFDNVAAAVFFVKNRVIHRCNRGMEEMLGYGAGELVGQPTQIYHPSVESWEAMGRQVHPPIHAGEVSEGEWQIMRKDGALIWISFRGRALDPADESQGTIWVAHDITERKRSETALLEAKANLERGLAEVEQLNTKVSLLGELTGFLQACPSAAEAFSCINEFGPRLFLVSVGALYLAEESGDLWAEQGHWGGEHFEHTLPTQSFLGSACWALRRSRAYRVDTPAGALCCPHVTGRSERSRPYTCLPLTAQGKTFGLLHLEHHEAQTGAEADRRQGLAVAMAEQIALAIANVQLREALLQQSIRDPLTGLYNRRYLQESLFREMAHSKRNQSTLAVMMIDVDHFKKFNDTFGHHAGDVVLQHVARVIEACFRRSDIACRFGGEEFTVVLPGTGVELAQRLANGLLEGIRDLALSHENRPLDHVTASLGLAIFPEHGNSPSTLIEAADAALYQAKTAGRNRVMVSPSAAG